MRTRVRATELYHRDTPFRQKIVKSKKTYNRKKDRTSTSKSSTNES